MRGGGVPGKIPAVPRRQAEAKGSECMSENAITVKELATELNVPPRDLLRVLRDLGIPAKSMVSDVAPEDLSRVREQFASSGGSSGEEWRESRSGVVVRRRRVPAGRPSPAQAAAAGPAEEKSAATAESQDKPLQEKTAAPSSVAEASAENEPAPAESGKAVSAPDVVVQAEAAEPQPEDSAAARAPAVPAENVAAGDTIPADAAGEEKQEKKQEAVPSPDNEASSSNKKASRKKSVHPAPVVARVISRPAASAAREAVQAPSAVPAPQTAENGSEAVQSPAAAPDASSLDKAEDKKAAAPANISSAGMPDSERKKDGTEKESGKEPVRIVRSSAPEQADGDAPRRARPAASARPEGSSAPSLLPPVEARSAERDREFSGSEERRERPRRQETPSTSHVRVISRPDAPAQSRRPAAAPAAENTESRDSRDNRDRRGNSRGYGARSGGSSRPGGPRPGGEFVMPDGGDSGREGQSKKKRNKNQNRRGADFQQMDISHRHEDDDNEMPRFRSRRRPQNRENRQAPQATQPQKAVKRKIRVEEGIRVADLAHQMGIKSGEIIKVLFGLGIMATINQTLDLDTAAVVASEFGYEVEKTGFVEDDYLAQAEVDAPESLKRRPPVVTIMGHVDHGKTSLLDAIRKTNVTSGEAGGITQHIGAYYVKTKNGDIVFLDTPGHEAFTAMRARGAQVTDFVVLVVAADDGVMEQTREAINHSRAAGVPIMVAVNKIDKPEANPDRVLRELAELGLVAEDWGGDTVVAKVSAKTRQGLDEMLELLALQAEILDLKANPDKPARGHIVEAKLDKGRGPVATVLIQEGTLHQGDTFVCGVFSGRVRAMFNDQGRKVKEAGPSRPVEVQGFEGVPEAGEPFICLTDEKLARRIAESRAVKQRERDLAKESRVTLETFLSQPAEGEETRTLNLVVKSDVQGSLEAIVEALKKQSTDKVKIEVIHGGAGAITESDILLASASQAIVIGFNVRPTAKVKTFAEQEGIDIRFYDIIYKLVDEIKSAMAGLLAPVSREVYLGQAEVRQIFTVPKVGTVAGCFVADGKITRAAGVRLLRDGIVVHTGKLASLKRFKDDAREVLKGYECGMSIENFNDIKMGDVIEAFETVTEAAQL